MFCYARGWYVALGYGISSRAYLQSDLIKGQTSSRGQSASEMPCGYQIWSEEPLTRENLHCWGQRSSRGQPKVNQLRNALWPPMLEGRTADNSVIFYWGRWSCKCQLGSTRDQFVSECQIPWEESLTIALYFFWGQKSCKSHPRLTRGNLHRNVLWPPTLV